ncbi:MAG: hypothetical protein MUF18_10790 [Fimbriiglobus sp.]|jgi:hypothetical protein|nr:hypothetical protein [Fimbriiglobus sp.]
MIRQRWAVAVLAATLSGVPLMADPPKDTRAAEFTRTKKLKGKVTVEAKNLPLKEILLDISTQLQDQKLGIIATEYDTGVSGNTRTSLEVKDLPAEEALDKLLGSLELGYIILSKEGNAHDGYLRIVKGKARGYEPGTEPKDVAKPAEPKKPDPKPEVKPETKPNPKPATGDEDEIAAGVKLEAAKKLIADEKADDAKKVLKYVVKFYPKTIAAGEAKKLLDDMK